METIRINRHTEEGVPAPAQAAAYDVYGTDGADLPELHEDVCGFVARVSQALRERQPAGVEAVVAYTPVSWLRRPEEIQLLTFGSFDHPLDPLDEMAEAVGPAVGELASMPVMEGFTPAEWNEAARQKDRLWRHVTGRGILLYEPGR